MLVALRVVEEAFSPFGLDTVVTSCNDGEHMENSKHYSGEAMDFRTKHAAGIMRGVALQIAKRLDPLGFDTIWEDQGLENEHLHVEWDPKEGE